jgi:DNA-binding PadR family transcriptional regulator
MFQILLALAEGQRHGYAVMHEVEERTGNEVQLPPGTLYRSIKRLLDAELIERLGEGKHHDARRVYYRITKAGRKAASVEAAKLSKLVALARQRRLIPATEL